MLTTLEDTYSLLTDHCQRVRDLTEQAANGTYGTQSLRAIESEITARLEEINRIAANCEFNGLKMMSGTMSDISIQVGLYGDEYSRIELKNELFDEASVEELFDTYGGMTGADVESVAQKCAGFNDDGTISSDNATGMLTVIDKVINQISERVTTLGAAQNRIDSAIESIAVQSENITSSLSTLRDADIAEESSNYIQSQILQQAAATLLATANQTPSIALNLL
jgi:flagellin